MKLVKFILRPIWLLWKHNYVEDGEILGELIFNFKSRGFSGSKSVVTFESLFQKMFESFTNPWR